MPRLGTPLDTGDAFPEMTLRTVDGREITLPGDLCDEQRGRWGVFLVYRAHW